MSLDHSLWGSLGFYWITLDTSCDTSGSKGTSSTLPRPPERDSMKVHHPTFILSPFLPALES